MSSFISKFKKPVRFLGGRSVASKTKPACDLPFDLNVESASNWLQNLPIDANRSWQLIISAIQSLNQSHCDSSTRLFLLETLRPVVFHLSKKLHNYTPGSNLPVAKKRKIAQLAVKLHLEIAAGYDLITRLDSFASDFPQDEQTRIIYRAMRSYSLSLLRSCQMYESYPSKIWERLNHLYGIAETRGFTDTVIDESEHSLDFETSIGDVFKVIVVFTIINPYRFSRQEMSNVFGMLEQTSDIVQLSSYQYEQGYLASICVRLQSNSPPTLVSQSTHNENNLYFFTKVSEFILRSNKAI